MAKPLTFQARLKKIVAEWELTAADLQHWFSRPYPTVWRWVHSGWVPRGPGGRKAERDLTDLEALLSSKQSAFPIPAHIGVRLRREYVRSVYVARHRLPQARTAK